MEELVSYRGAVDSGVERNDLPCCKGKGVLKTSVFLCMRGNQSIIHINIVEFTHRENEPNDAHLFVGGQTHAMELKILTGLVLGRELLDTLGAMSFTSSKHVTLNTTIVSC